MNTPKALSGKLGILLCSAVLGYTTCGQPSVSVGLSVPLPAVEIRAESDFYEPLAPQGEWVVVGSYGRCWRPGHVARDWRPYCSGNWQRTDAGWYWVSDEPWAWATYHYGRWDFTDQYGWYWVPQTQWAPAWVSWHSGGGYVGWAPLQPSVTISVSGYVGFNQSRIPSRAFVFVEQRQFLDPIRPTTVVVNNATIINKTTTITNTRIVNNTIVNEGPATAVVEKASGRKIQAVPVQELRHKTEATVAARQQAAAPPSEKKQKNAQTPVPGEAKTLENKIAAAPAPPQVQKPAAATHTPTPLIPTGPVRESEKPKSNPSQPNPRPETPRPATIKGPTPQTIAHSAEPSEKPARKSEQKASEPVPHDNEKPAPSEKNDRGAGEQGPKQKTEQRQTPPEKPALPAPSSP